MTDRPTALGKRGSRTTLTKNKVSETLDQQEEHVQGNLPIGVPTASVGLSVSAGMNTEFGREKIEVSAWCTLPCLPEPSSIERAYAACYKYASEQAKESLDKAVREFFPELSGDGS